MKKVWVFLLMLIFAGPGMVTAKTHNYFKPGINYSLFRAEEGKSQPGLSFGLGRRFYPIRNFVGFWGIELGYAQEKISLEDKTWPTSSHPPYSGVEKGNFEISLGYLDLTLYFGYPIIATKIIGIEFLLGPCLSIPINNRTKVNVNKTEYLDPEESSNYDFDFFHYDADPGEKLIPVMERGMNLKTSLIVGTKFSWKNFHLLLNYSRAFIETEGIVSLTLFDKIDRFSFSAEIDF